MRGVLRRDVARHPRDSSRARGSATSATRSRRFVEEQRFSVVREYCGHGIGRVFHEDPQVLHYGRPGTGLELVPGMTITVEPMVNAGKRDVKLLSDGWTVVTKDHSLSAQWEHTVLVTPTGFEVLTLEPGRSRGLTSMRDRRSHRRRLPLIDRARARASAARRRHAPSRRSAKRCKSASERLGERFRRNEPIETLVRGARARRRRGHPRELGCISPRARSTRPISSPSAATAAASCIRSPTSICSSCIAERIEQRRTTRSAAS